MASTAVQMISNLRDTAAVRVRITHTCGAASAVFTATPISDAIMATIKGMMLHKMTTNPGATAPTGNWDITLVDENGVDMLTGAGANRHTTTSQTVFPILISQAQVGDVMVGTELIPTITGNSVNAAIIAVDLYFRKPR